MIIISRKVIFDTELAKSENLCSFQFVKPEISKRSRKHVARVFISLAELSYKEKAEDKD